MIWYTLRKIKFKIFFIIYNIIFPSKNFIEILQLNLDTKGITKDTKQKCLKDIKKLIDLKNKIFNLKYLVYMFDTAIFDKYINKLGVEDLINSTIIFEVIDSYALQFEELMKFEHEIRNIQPDNFIDPRNCIKTHFIQLFPVQNDHFSVEDQIIIS